MSLLPFFVVFDFGCFFAIPIVMGLNSMLLLPDYDLMQIKTCPQQREFCLFGDEIWR
jgi:hypothetical protein